MAFRPAPIENMSSGATLTIEAKGNFTEEVGDGAYIRLTVKYGLITLLHSTADLCEQMKNVDEDCPLAGEKTVTKEVSLPKTIPPVHDPLYPSIPSTFG